jgi:AcrR family transcriptional regulator
VATANQRSARRQRHDEVRGEVQRATLELIEQAPFKDLSVDEIARAAGLSRSAFYFYFRDKNDLLMAAGETLTEELYREAERWWLGKGEPRESVRAAVGGVVAIMERHSGLFRVATEVSTYDPEVGEFWRTLIGRFVDATAEHLGREQAAGRVRASLDPEAAAEALVWGVERTLYVFLGQERQRPQEELVDTLASLWLGAIYLEGS